MTHEFCFLISRNDPEISYQLILVDSVHCLISRADQGVIRVIRVEAIAVVPPYLVKFTSKQITFPLRLSVIFLAEATKVYSEKRRLSV